MSISPSVPAGVGAAVVQGRTDYERLAAIYDTGRKLPLEWIEAWRDSLDPYLSAADLPVLDLGSGTGLWSEALATWFETDIMGVEPSDAMRIEAATKGLRPKVALVGGKAERIPLRDGSCACAWLSTVIHHISDLEACAAELRRVISMDGAVLIRNSFGDRLEGINWLDFFPTAKEIASKRWPTVEATVRAFGTAGFEVEKLQSVPEIIASDFRAYHDRIRVRANSTLNVVDDEAFHAGLARLMQFASRQPSERVVDQRDFLVLR
jgi:ubiquinone/menaquinone biosynthesis C-methylase UbiE